jgi:predicted RNA binding protein YcfA (HicA-like mRNA interferase family)
MKRIDLIRAIESSGCVLIRHGGKHDWYRNPVTGMAQAVPRHREIQESLARRIIRTLTEPPKEPHHKESPEDETQADDNNA